MPWHAGNVQLRVHVSREVDFDLASICRDDRCKFRHVHAYHEIVESASMVRQRIKALGWENDPLEPMHIDPVKHTNPSPAALQHMICKATSLHTTKTFGMLARETREEYGDVTDRTIYRALSKLIEHKRVLYVKPFEFLKFGGYLRPGSKLPSYSDGAIIIAEQIRSALHTEAMLRREGGFEERSRETLAS